MFNHAERRIPTRVAEHIGELIRASSHSGTHLTTATSAQIEHRLRDAQAKLTVRLEKVKTMRAFLEMTESEAEQDRLRLEWNRQSGLLANTYQQVLTLIGPQLDLTATLVLEFLADNLWNLHE